MRLEVSTSRRQDEISTFTAHSDDGDGRLSAVDLSILQRTTDRSCDVVVLCQRSKRGGFTRGMSLPHAGACQWQLLLHDWSQVASGNNGQA